MTGPEAKRSAGEILLVLAPVAAGLAAAGATGAMGLGLAGVLVGALVAWRVSGGGWAGWQALGFVRPRSWPRTVGIAVVATALLHLILTGALLPALARTFGPPDLSAFAELPGRPDLLVTMLVVSVVNGAFAEEIVGRGFLQRRLEQLFGDGRFAAAGAVVIASALFGLGHAYQGMTGVIGTAVAGAVFGLAMVADRRVIWAAVIAHGLYDWSAFIMLYLTGGRTD